VEAQTRRSLGRRSGFRRKRTATLTTLALLLVACSASHPHADGHRQATATVLTNPPRRPDATVAPRPALPISARIQLASATIRGGARAHAVVIVENNTGRALHPIGCIDLFGIALSNEEASQPHVGFMCRQTFNVPTGESRYPVTFSSYAWCGQGKQASLRKCLPGGRAPSLPAGDYRAELIDLAGVVPAPPAPTVHVTATP
jgi:hypothetical protein